MPPYSRRFDVYRHPQTVVIVDAPLELGCVFPLGAGDHVQITHVSGQGNIEPATGVGWLVPKFHLGDIRAINGRSKVVDQRVKKRIGARGQDFYVENRIIDCPRRDGGGIDMTYSQVGGPTRLDGLDARISNRGSGKTAGSEHTAVRRGLALNSVSINCSRQHIHGHEQSAVRGHSKAECSGVLPGVGRSGWQDTDQGGLCG